jgi:hypothetical protein
MRRLVFVLLSAVFLLGGIIAGWLVMGPRESAAGLSHQSLSGNLDGAAVRPESLEVKAVTLTAPEEGPNAAAKQEPVQIRRMKIPTPDMSK